MKKIMLLCIVGLLLIGTSLYAANGDLIVNGNLGIGTSAPASRLSVGGDGDSDVGIYGAGSWSGIHGDGGWNGFYGSGGYNGVLSFGAVNGLLAYGNDTGVVANGGPYGVQATGWTYGVYSSGDSYDFYAVGPGIDYGTASSIRWKTNITPISNALAKVMTLRGVYYDLDKEHGGKRDVGFIGEEVAKVLPEITAPDPEAPGYVTGMDYSKITPLLLEAIKEQQKQIADLQQQIAELKKKAGQ